MKPLDITEKLESFDRFLHKNPRVIFSAKFGDGKTYFLKEYIAKHQIWSNNTPQEQRIGSAENIYFTILHPVNYVVAKNEDIFEYIKRDILYQLYNEGRADNVDYKAVVEALGEAAFEEVIPLIENLVYMLQGGEFVKTFVEFAKKVKSSYKKKRKTCKQFLNGFEQQKGGIFERDAYTQMIQTTLEHLQEPKKNVKCKKVLIIEDMDRLDPGHLFRILNVLGAHIDDDKKSNKFGFDNIVLVLDYETTKHIFHHFYGDAANYDGYMSKFMSSCVYHYSISHLAHQALINKLKDEYGEQLLYVKIRGLKLVAQNTFYIWDLIKTLSVRQVEQVLYYISRIGAKRAVLNNVLYVLDCPFLCLMKLLILINQSSFQYDSIKESLENLKDDMWKFMGVYIGLLPDVEGKSILVNNSYYKLTPHHNDEGACDYYEATTTDKTTNVTSFDIVLRRAINMAKRIVDGGDILEARLL